MLVGGAAQLYQIKRTSDVDLSCPLLLSNWESMKSGEIQWLLAHYSSSKEVVFFQSGNLVVDMIQYLNPDSVYYGAFVVYHDSIRRHVFFSYVGDDVAGMKRARVSMHKSALSNYFQGSIYTMSLSQPEELNVQYVLSCLSSVGIEPSSVSIDFTCREDIHSPVETTDVKTSETELMLLSRSTIGGQPHPPSEWLGDSSEFDFDGKSIWYELASFIHSLSPQDSSMPLSVPSCSGSIDCSLSSWVTEVLNCHLCPPLEDLIKLRTVLSKSMHAPLVIQVGGMESLPIIWNNILLDTIDKPGTKTLSKLLLVACMCELASHLLKNVCTTSNFSSDNDQSQKKISSSPSSPAATTTETRHAMTKPKETKEISISSSQVCDNNKTVNPEASLIQSRAQKTESSGEDSGKKVNPVASLIQSRAQQQEGSDASDKKVNPVASLIQSKAQKTESSSEDSGKKVNPVASLIQSRAQKTESSNENCGDESCTDVTSDRGVTDMTVSSNSSVKVVYQMRQCYWEPVADCEGTIFDPAVPAAGDIDKMGSNYLSEGVLDSLREVFTKTITIRELTEEERIGQAVGAIGGKLKKGSLTFMDQRRFNNVAIKLRQMNKSNEFIKTAVLRLDEEFLTPERVQSLLECAPTGDDMESIAPYDGDPDLLAVCERFFYDIQSVPLFTKRIEAMKARLEFEAGVEDVLSQLGDLTHAILSVANSSALAVFIRVVLKFGNVMNCGSSRGSAIGFDISFLPKLSYIKSGDLKTNLMRFVVNHLDSEDTSVIDSLLRSLAPCAKAAKVNFHRVDGAITLLKKRLNSIKMTRTSLLNINKRRKDGKLPDDFFEEKMGSFMTSAEALLEQMLSGEVTRVRHVYNLLNRFLGMVSSDSNETSASASLFSVLLDLCRNVEEARRTTAALLAREREIALKHDALVRAAESRTVIKASRLRQETSVCTNSPKTSVQSSLRKSTGYGHGNNSREESATEVLESEIARVRARMRASGTSQSRSLLNISSEQALKNTIHINGEQNVAHASLNGVKRPLNHSKINSNSRPCEDMTIGTLTVSRSCVQASMDMQNPESDTNWVGMRLDCTSNRLELVGKGGHGLSEMTEWVGQIGSACAATSTALDQSYHSRQCTSTDLPSVVYFRVIGVDEAFRRSKFVAVYFINPNLPMKLRAHMSHMKRHIQSFLSGVHVEFSVEDSLAELTEESVTRKLLAAGGAHAPKSFVF